MVTKTLKSSYKLGQLNCFTAGPFTVLAPNNAAFAKIDKKALDALLADKEGLKKVLLRHVIARQVGSKDLSSGPVQTVGGDVITAAVAPGPKGASGLNSTQPFYVSCDFKIDHFIISHFRL